MFIRFNNVECHHRINSASRQVEGSTRADTSVVRTVPHISGTSMYISNTQSEGVCKISTNGGILQHLRNRKFVDDSRNTVLNATTIVGNNQLNIFTIEGSMVVSSGEVHSNAIDSPGQGNRTISIGNNVSTNSQTRIRERSAFANGEVSSCERSRVSELRSLIECEINNIGSVSEAFSHNNANNWSRISNSGSRFNSSVVSTIFLQPESINCNSSVSSQSNSRLTNQEVAERVISTSVAEHGSINSYSGMTGNSQLEGIRSSGTAIVGSWIVNVVVMIGNCCFRSGCPSSVITKHSSGCADFVTLRGNSWTIVNNSVGRRDIITVANHIRCSKRYNRFFSNRNGNSLGLGVSRTICWNSGDSTCQGVRECFSRRNANRTGNSITGNSQTSICKLSRECERFVSSHNNISNSAIVTYCLGSISRSSELSGVINCNSHNIRVNFITSILNHVTKVSSVMSMCHWSCRIESGESGFTWFLNFPTLSVNVAVTIIGDSRSGQSKDFTFANCSRICDCCNSSRLAYHERDFEGLRWTTKVCRGNSNRDISSSGTCHLQGSTRSNMRISNQIECDCTGRINWISQSICRVHQDIGNLKHGASNTHGVINSNSIKKGKISSVVHCECSSVRHSLTTEVLDIVSKIFTIHSSRHTSSGKINRWTINHPTLRSNNTISGNCRYSRSYDVTSTCNNISRSSNNWFLTNEEYNISCLHTAITSSRRGNSHSNVANCNRSNSNVYTWTAVRDNSHRDLSVISSSINCITFIHVNSKCVCTTGDTKRIICCRKF